MPISTNINSPDALYALMTTTDIADLSQAYTQTANIDMSTYPYPATSIAGGDAITPRDFSGIYNGQGYSITIGDVTDYTGLFDSVVPRIGVTSGIIKNINLIYKNPISITLNPGINNLVWGGLCGAVVNGIVTNCSVTINNTISVTSPYAAPVGMLCGFVSQNSLVTQCTLMLNGNIEVLTTADINIGLLIGQSTDSDITNCSITSTHSAYNISLTGDLHCNIGLICGLCAANILSVPVRRTSLVNITATFNNNGTITLDRANPSNPINAGAICGNLAGDTTPDTTYQTIVRNCKININNNQVLVGGFQDFFGIVDGTVTVTESQFLYRTTTDNSSRPMEINPTPSAGTAVSYVNSYTNIYTIPSGNYYIPNTEGSLKIGGQTLAMQSQLSPDGILINGTLYVINSTYSATNDTFIFTIAVKGVGSMYFGLITIMMPESSATKNAECICNINSCATNPQTGITEDSRITNIVQDKTIRINVDREFATNSVIYPKFNSYRDYINYIQGGLKY